MDRAPTRCVGQEIERFERLVLPHLDAAHNLARWLTRNDADAADVVQEAVLRAFRYFGAFRGNDARGWFLATVRNTTWSWLERNRPEAIVPVDELEALAPEIPGGDPSAVCDDRELGAALNEAIAALPAEFREALLLREVEGMSYKEIAAVVDAPIGTVMSRLARARAILRVKLAAAGWR